MALSKWLDYFAGSALPSGLQSAGGPITPTERIAAALATLASTTNPDGTAYSLPVTSIPSAMNTPTIPGAPTTANILAGQAAVTATQAATTFMTVPSGRTWYGTISINTSVAEAATGAVAGLAEGVVSITGGTPSPSGALLQCDAQAGANAAAGAVGSQGNGYTSITCYINATGGAATVQLATTVTGTSGKVNVTAAGILL